MNVIYEDNHLLVVDKPADLSTMGAEPGVQTLHHSACDYLRKKYRKPGKVFLGIVSRLDTVTSGVIVLARTSKAASRLSTQFAKTDSNAPTKLYLAAVDLRDGDGIWTGMKLGETVDIRNAIRKDDAARRMRVCAAGTPEAKLAHLRTTLMWRDRRRAVVACRLITGRKHQIRVQLSDAGTPILGDRKYDSTAAFGRGIALHSWRLRIEHPTRRVMLDFSAGLPKSWASLRSAAQAGKATWLATDAPNNAELGSPEAQAGWPESAWPAVARAQGITRGPE